MIKWAEVILALMGAAFVSYAMLQNHEYRLGRIESSLDKHLLQHEALNAQLMNAVNQTQVDVAEIKAQLKMMSK